MKQNLLVTLTNENYADQAKQLFLLSIRIASGKPVIAANKGGYKETVINKETGVLIEKINEDKLIKAIKEIGKNPKKYKNACLKQAEKFDTKVFIKKIREEIEDNEKTYFKDVKKF